MKQAIADLAASLDMEITWLDNSTPAGISVDSAQLHGFMKGLHATEGLYFDFLSCLTGLDNGPEAGTMEALYHLHSIPYNLQLMVKVQVDREKPQIPSVSDIWHTANWHEREAFDLLGINFINHPDLRRILLPADWEGYPLRKDYQEQEKYHGITVAYDNGE